MCVCVCDPCGVKISVCKLVLTGIYSAGFVVSLSGVSDNKLKGKNHGAARMAGFVEC